VKIAVLGAGISGLASAWFLQQKYGSQAEVIVFEKESRAGGWIQTIHQDGFLFDQGPRSCRASGTGAATLELVEALGLRDQVICSSPSAHTRYVYEGGRLNRLPGGILPLLASSWLPVAIKALWRDWRAPPGTEPDESIASFIERRLGCEVVERLIDPLTAGIYAGNVHELSIRSCFPTFYEWEQTHGSLLKGALAKKKAPSEASLWVRSIQKNGLFSFKKGMEGLTQALASRLDVRYGMPVMGLTAEPEGCRLTFSDGSCFEADRVVSTLPATALSRLLPLMPSLPMASVTVVNLGYRQTVLKHEGFGYLIPSREKEPLLGVVWDSSVFPQQNAPDQTRLTVMMKADPEKGDPIDLIKETLGRQMGITAEPAVVAVRHAYQAIPHYPIGYFDNIHAFKQLCQKGFPRLQLSGTPFHGVSVNDCIHAAGVASEVCKKSC